MVIIMFDKKAYVYILTNRQNGTLYIGVTNNLITRVSQHKSKVIDKSFTNKYNIDKLVYYEVYDDMYNAITREKQLKAGSREKKIKLIEEYNKDWKDLYESLFN